MLGAEPRSSSEAAPSLILPLQQHVIVSLLAQARDNLELSFVNEADMVFTTLSSTGRRVRSTNCQAIAGPDNFLISNALIMFSDTF